MRGKVGEGGAEGCRRNRLNGRSVVLQAFLARSLVLSVRIYGVVSNCAECTGECEGGDVWPFVCSFFVFM